MIDLHTHSIHSDGTKTPSELLNLAKEKNIKVRVSADLVGPIIDQFGKNETSIEETKDGLEVSFRAATSNNLYGWLIGLGDVEVISPPSVRKEMQDLIQKNISFYIYFFLIMIK